MNTPVADFLKNYSLSGTHRLHMPGHKGTSFLGCEALDITEIDGADVLGQSQGILKESQENAAALFGTRETHYATGGSSQCIQAMLYLAMTCRRKDALPVIAAARNVHQAFVYGAALLDISPLWLWPETAQQSVCSCPITPEALDKALSGLSAPVAGVYVTSPDYLGQIQPIQALAEVCHRHKTVLLVDNAHGAYLRFLSQHPMDLGADLCCDSAHKTLPVLTGGAYLHISRNAPERFSHRAAEGLVMFGTTSPSYLILGSLDKCNGYLSGEYPTALRDTIARLDALKARLTQRGWPIAPSDPLRLTIHGSQAGISGEALSQRLREKLVECEFADRDDLVLMVTPQNTQADLDAVEEGLGFPPGKTSPSSPLPLGKCPSAMSPRQAVFAPHETLPAEDALGRICGSPVVGFPLRSHRRLRRTLHPGGPGPAALLQHPAGEGGKRITPTPMSSCA